MPSPGQHLRSTHSRPLWLRGQAGRPAPALHVEAARGPAGHGQGRGGRPGGRGKLPRRPRGEANPTPTLVALGRVGSPLGRCRTPHLPRPRRDGPGRGLGGGMSIAGSAATCLSPSLPSFPPVSIILIHALTPNAWISPHICSLRPPFAYSSPNSLVLMCHLEPPTGAPPTPRWKCDCCWLMGAATCTTQALPLDFGEHISKASPASRGANSTAEQAGRCPGFLTCDFLASTVGVLKAVSFHTDAGAQHV